MVDKRGLGKNYTIASAATSRDDLGSPVHQGTRKKLAQHGIGCQGKRATLMTPQDYDRYDLLIGMDEENLRGMRRIAGGDPRPKCTCCWNIPAPPAISPIPGIPEILTKPGTTCGPAAPRC